MKQRKLFIVALVFVATILWLVTSYGGYVDREVKATPRVGTTTARSGPLPPVPSGRGTIGPVNEIRCVLGTPGKNIVASWTGEGDTLQAVYAHDSGNPDEHMLLWYAQSFDRGASWTEASSTLGPARARRLYPGIEQLTADGDRVPYIAWHQGYYSGGAYLRHPLFWTYDEFFPFMLFTPRCFDPADSATTHFWFPSMEMSSSGDTIIISAANINQSGSPTAGNAYVWRSLDGGGTWQKSLMVDTQGAGMLDIDSPLLCKGPGGYVFGYFEWAEPPATDTNFIPHYTESTDCGATWSAPTNLGAPYVDATGWWYSYDVILDENDGYRPHIAIKFSPENYEFSDVWELHPYSGSMGSWSNWQYTLLVGDPNGGQRLATQPSIGMQRGTSNIFITFSYFSDSAAGQLDIGMRYSSDGGQTWDPQIYQLTDDMVAEEAVELAYDVSECLHIIYLNDRDAPTYAMHLAYCDIGAEEKVEVLRPEAFALTQNKPNPFSRTTGVRYQIPDTRQTKLSVYDLAGRLVRTLVDEERSPGAYTAVWDGRDDLGKSVANGVYLYRLKAGEFTATKGMVLLR